MREKEVDRPLLIITILLIGVGFLGFISASLGLLAKETANIASVIFNQTVFGLIGGSLSAFLIIRYLNHRNLNRYSLYLLILGLVLTALVFVPGISFEHGGARRWLLVGPFSFQPVEFLKIVIIIYWASWLSGVKKRIEDFRFGLIPLFTLIAVFGSILILQPDTDNFLVIATALVLMFFASGSRTRDLILIFIIGLIGASGVVLMKPYIKDRIITFLNPGSDPLGSGYQIQQSLIAVGSGGIFGRGLGKSVQKFSFLPEPIGDSVFAVFAEEWGFLGASILIILFILFSIRGLEISKKIKDDFGRLMIIGFVSMIIFQSFLNIGAMIGALPLAGIPLVFVSHGGTSLLFTLVQVGIILNLSKR